MVIFSGVKKRQFLKTVSTAAASIPLMGFAPQWSNTSETKSLDLTTNEDFWDRVRKDYLLKPEYINLESGYYNIVPQPTLKATQAKMDVVNREGSYYMRTVQWENKDRVADAVGRLVGSSGKNVIITRNTTESLDLVIQGFPWKQGDEALFAVQD